MLTEKVGSLLFKPEVGSHQLTFPCGLRRRREVVADEGVEEALKNAKEKEKRLSFSKALSPNSAVLSPPSLQRYQQCPLTKDLTSACPLFSPQEDLTTPQNAASPMRVFPTCPRVIGL